MGRKLGVALAAVFVVAAGVVGWRLFSAEPDAGPGDLTARLTDYWTSSQHELYAYPEWWTDGRSLARFAEAAGRLEVRPMGPAGGLEQPSTVRTLGRGDGVKPRALAVTPGDGGRRAFVAVGIHEAPEGAEQQPVLAWTAELEPSKGLPDLAPVELPVKVEPTTSSENIITVDAAIMSVAEQPAVAVVQVHQGDTAQLVTCEIGAGPCEWKAAPPPAGGGYVSLGASSRGIVAVTDEERPAIWSASDASLDWTRVGQAPKGFRSAQVQDGADRATLIWQAKSDLVIQTVDGDDVTTAVGEAKVPGDPDRFETALRLGDQWYLGGSTAGDPDAYVGYRPAAAGLWALDGDRWRRVSDPLLTKQVDQSFVALLADDKDELVGVTASVVLDTELFWRFAGPS